MKKMIFCLMALVACSTMNAQRLVAFKGYGTNWDKSMLSSKNKPNGFMYRLREDVQWNPSTWDGSPSIDSPQVPTSMTLWWCSTITTSSLWRP